MGMGRPAKRVASLLPFIRKEHNGEVLWVWSITKYSVLGLLVAIELLVAATWFVFNDGPLSMSLDGYLSMLLVWVCLMGLAVIATLVCSFAILFEWMQSSPTVQQQYRGRFSVIIPFAGMVFLVNLFLAIAVLFRP